MIVTDVVHDYLRQLSLQPDDVLAEMEAHGARDQVPIVPPETGEMLHVLALACSSRRIVEVGTAIGVSTLYLARALPADGEIVSFEIDERRHAAARNYLDRAGVGDRATLHLRDAREGLSALEPEFDMAFIDGVKAQYGDYLEALVPLLRPGGVLAIDNVLMGGSVAEGRASAIWSQEQVDGARAFNARVLGHELLTGTVTPVGDGLLVAVRR